VKESILTVLGLLLAIFGISYAGYQMHAFYAPRYAAVDNQVFHESAQYNDGMIRDLENLEMQYRDADDAGKAALKATVLHRFSVYPEDRLPANLRNFYTQLRGY